LIFLFWIPFLGSRLKEKEKTSGKKPEVLIFPLKIIEDY